MTLCALGPPMVSTPMPASADRITTPVLVVYSTLR